MAIAATANNLMLGYAGMVSFGLAAPYGIGAYTFAILIKTGIPFWLALLSGPIVTCIIMVPIGWLCIRRKGLYFAMLTLAFAQINYTVIVKWYSLTGGEDGIAGLPIPDLIAPTTHYFYFAIVATVICLGFMWVLVNSPYGKTIQGMKQNPVRADSIGVNLNKYKLITFTISSFFLGLAGALFAGFDGSAFPVYAFWSKTFDINIVCLIGGINTFWGPSMGAVIYFLLTKIITSYTEYWPLILGLIVLFMTLYLRGGALTAIMETFFPLIERNKR